MRHLKRCTRRLRQIAKSSSDHREHLAISDGALFPLRPTGARNNRLGGVGDLAHPRCCVLTRPIAPQAGDLLTTVSRAKPRRKDMMDQRLEQRIWDEVKQLFDSLRAPTGECGTCPVTGGRFLWGHDRLAPVVERAVRTKLARLKFRRENPTLPDLPLTYPDRESMKGMFSERYGIALYARSLAARSYKTAGHPSFETYARGLLAVPHFRDWANRDAPELLRRYPPEFLPGLNEAGYFNGTWRPANIRAVTTA